MDLELASEVQEGGHWKLQSIAGLPEVQEIIRACDWHLKYGDWVRG